jgi:uncharacterized protein YkwD
MSPIYRPALLLFTLIFGAFYHSAVAQQAGTQPVARLISATAVKPVLVGPVSPGSALTEANEIERRAFEETNVVRVQHGLEPFVWDGEVCRMARIHSESMARLGYLSHTTPAGLRLRDRARAVGIQQFTVLGENIAYNQGYEDPGAFAVERWMASSKHRENILSREFRAMAIGSFITADGSVYLTQTFITR